MNLCNPRSASPVLVKQREQYMAMTAQRIANGKCVFVINRTDTE